MSTAPPARFDEQYTLDRRDYLAHLDFYTWTRHYHVFKDIGELVTGDLLEVGTGDGVVRRCVEPFVRSTTVMDINPRLQPDVLGNLLDPQPTMRSSAPRCSSTFLSTCSRDASRTCIRSCVPVECCS
jgi:hypothetical protein